MTRLKNVRKTHKNSSHSEKKRNRLKKNLINTFHVERDEKRNNIIKFIRSLDNDVDICGMKRSSKSMENYLVDERDSKIKIQWKNALIIHVLPLFSLSIQIIENNNFNLILQLLRHYIRHACMKISGDNDDVVDSWRTCIKYQNIVFCVLLSRSSRTFQPFFFALNYWTPSRWYDKNTLYMSEY